MIRTLAIAAAAATVGYVAGQRAAKSPESRFARDQPTESGVGGFIDRDDVTVEDGKATLTDDARRDISSNIGNSDVAAHQVDWPGEIAADTDGEGKA
jgi:hypothetical protein